MWRSGSYYITYNVEYFAFLRVHVVLLGATGSMVNFTYVYQLFFLLLPIIASIWRGGSYYITYNGNIFCITVGPCGVPCIIQCEVHRIS